MLLAKGISLSAASQITARMNKLNVAGIDLTPAYTRTYPGGDLASNLVGFTTTTSGGDLRGQAGIEQSYNSLLAGRDGQQEVETGTNGQPIPVATDWVRPMVPGGDVKLTILSGLQWEAQQACAQQVRLTRADSCTAVVMRPGTGQILAMAQYPGYQPSHVTGLAATEDMPVSAVFPPGSTAKVITAAAALERGGQTPMSPYTVPEQITVGGAYTFHDADPHPTERLTLAGVLAHSSNVGMVQVAQHVSPQVQYQYFRAFGIGAPSGLPLPGTSPGLLVPLVEVLGAGALHARLRPGCRPSPPCRWPASTRPSRTAGSGYSRPSWRARRRPAGGSCPRRRPTASACSSPRPRPSSSPSSSRCPCSTRPWPSSRGGRSPAIPSPPRPAPRRWAAASACYGSSYIGMAPASNPQLVVAVNVQNPKRGSYFGNAVAGPVFYHVMKFALQTLKIPPDGGKRPNVRLTAP